MLSSSVQQDIKEGSVYETGMSDRDLASLSLEHGIAAIREIHLDFSECTTLEPLRRMTGVESLALVKVPEGADLEALSALSNLRELSFSRSPALGTLSFLQNGLRKLESLALLNCSNLVTFQGLEGARGVKDLQVDFSEKLLDISAVSTLRNLESLVIRNAPRLIDISPVLELEKLNFINLDGCPRIPDPQIEQLRNFFPAATILGLP
jgi:hypothetical protein